MILERLQSTFVAMRLADGQVLLSVDHIHRLLGGEDQRYPIIDVANLLKPALARGQIQLMGACTLAQYRQYLARDAAVQRRFQEVLMPDALEECQRLLAQQAPSNQA
jgi:ATP-dependent Clp protease ATP-binding subunit ClpA